MTLVCDKEKTRMTPQHRPPWRRIVAISTIAAAAPVAQPWPQRPQWGGPNRNVTARACRTYCAAYKQRRYSSYRKSIMVQCPNGDFGNCRWSATNPANLGIFEFRQSPVKLR